MAFLWLINGGDPNHLRTGMILQVVLLDIFGWEKHVMFLTFFNLLGFARASRFKNEGNYFFVPRAYALNA